MFKSLLSIIFVTLSLLLSSVNGYPIYAKDEEGSNVDQYEPDNNGYNGAMIEVPASSLFYFGVLIVILLALNVSCQCYSNCFKNSNLRPKYSKVNGIHESDQEVQCLNV